MRDAKLCMVEAVGVLVFRSHSKGLPKPFVRDVHCRGTERASDFASNRSMVELAIGEVGDRVGVEGANRKIV